MRFSVWPAAPSSTTDSSTASGIVVTTTTVERQLPRNPKMSSPVRPAAIRPSTTTPWIAFVTNTDWSNRKESFSPSGSFTPPRRSRT